MCIDNFGPRIRLDRVIHALKTDYVRIMFVLVCIVLYCTVFVCIGSYCLYWFVLPTGPGALNYQLDHARSGLKSNISGAIVPQ